MSSLAYSEYNDSSAINNNLQQEKKKNTHNATVKKRNDTANNENVKNMLKIINSSNGYDNDSTDSTDSTNSSDLADFNPPARAQISKIKEHENANSLNTTKTEPTMKDINIDYEKPTTFNHNQTELDTSVKEVKPRQYPTPMDSYEGFNSLPKHYASDYYKQYVPYFNQGGNQSSNGPMSREHLLDKLNYMIYLLEEQKDEKTGHVMEEVILYSFLGVFIIFIVDSFARVGKYTR